VNGLRRLRLHEIDIHIISDAPIIGRHLVTRTAVRRRELDLIGCNIVDRVQRR